MFFVLCVSHAFASVHCCLLVTCWERADLMAHVGDICIFVTFPCGILGQVWYLVVSFPDLCLLSYFYIKLAFDLQKQFYIIKMIIACEYNVIYCQNCEFCNQKSFLAIRNAITNLCSGMLPTW